MCTKRTDLHHTTRRIEKNNVRVLEPNVSAKIALMKQVVLNVNSTQSTVFAMVALSTNAFELQISSHESQKINKYFLTFFLHLERARDFQFLLA